MNIVPINLEVEDLQLCSSILDSIEPHINRVSRLSVRDTEWVPSSVTASIVFLPTNCPVYGISSSVVPGWNSMDVCQFGKIARLSYLTADDDGLFIVVCTPSMYQMVFDVGGAAGWEIDHSTVAICKTPVCKEHEMSMRSLLVTVWKKIQPPRTVDISRPMEDTWFDTIEEHEWTLQENGQPLRGNSILQNL